MNIDENRRALLTGMLIGSVEKMRAERGYLARAIPLVDEDGNYKFEFLVEFDDGERLVVSVEREIETG